MSSKATIDEFRIEDIPLSCTWIIVGPPGCLGVDTPIMMYDGTIKHVQNVVVGDSLMGDNITPRQVLCTTRGVDEMYTISPSDGGPKYTVNSEHILCLKKDEDGNFVTEIKMTDFLALPDCEQKLYNGYRSDGSLYKLDIQSIGRDNFWGFQLDGNHRFLLGDRTVTHNSGKTTLIENLTYYHKHKYPVARAFIGTEGGYKRFCKIFHPLFVSNYYDEEEEKKHIERQRTLVLENHPTPYAVNILDDVSDDPTIYRTPTMRGLFKLGSQHWAQLLMVGSQYAIDMPPDVRKAVSYVAIFREPEEEERKKLYKNFGGLSGSYSNFCDLMDQLTGDYTCIIFKKRSQDNDMEKCIFYFKTKQLGNWKFGCKEYREWGEKRYNKSYKETVMI